MANGRIFVGTVATVVVTVALPGTQNATTSGIALELVLGTWNVAIALVRSISAIVDAVAQSRSGCAVVVVTLELSGFAETFFASAGLVRSVLTILFSIALPVERNATVVFASASMLASCAIGDTGLAVRRHEELIGTSALEANASVLRR